MGLMVSQKDLERIWKAARNSGIGLIETRIEPDGAVRVFHLPSDVDADEAMEDWLDRNRLDNVKW